ncbi:hypothetical protein [Maribacter ulvicola]|uniref:Uncharacterized protein n=1 Tax=Maribacter ulvicola TaxID=228959 RepID=A0A1N6ZFD4_9FLAO|nr:hypothetical protein [Maribacter ulvicola]SIR25471.1 hypothetical protein SAMN05421797_108164 [Maribacter ulvicola]
MKRILRLEVLTQVMTNCAVKNNTNNSKNTMAQSDYLTQVVFQ